jgi:hypothetical protein
LRGQVGCMVIVQAAGTAAALAASEGISVNQLNVPRLQKELAAAGVKLERGTESCLL